MKKKTQGGNLFVRCYHRKVLTTSVWVSYYPSTIKWLCLVTTNLFFLENFLADSDAESNGQKDAVQNKDEKKDNKGLSVAFDPSAGPPEEAPQGKV